MVASNKDLKKAKGGLAAPQHYNAKIDDFEYAQGENGASFVTVRNPVLDVDLQLAAVSPGAGNPFMPTTGNYTLTCEITGTSTSRTVVFEIAGPSGVYIPTTAYNVADPTKYGPQTTGGSDTAPESWQVDVPAGFSFRARLSAVAGGNVTIKGKAVS